MRVQSFQNWYIGDDSKTQRWHLPPVLAQEESQNREAAESRDLQDAIGCGEARASGAILQTRWMNPTGA
jgi:hypothetical protein